MMTRRLLTAACKCLLLLGATLAAASPADAGEYSVSPLRIDLDREPSMFGNSRIASRLVMLARQTGPTPKATNTGSGVFPTDLAGKSRGTLLSVGIQTET